MTPGTRNNPTNSPENRAFGVIVIIVLVLSLDVYFSGVIGKGFGAIGSAFGSIGNTISSTFSSKPQESKEKVDSSDASAVAKIPVEQTDKVQPNDSPSSKILENPNSNSSTKNNEPTSTLETGQAVKVNETDTLTVRNKSVDGQEANDKKEREHAVVAREAPAQESTKPNIVAPVTMASAKPIASPLNHYKTSFDCSTSRLSTTEEMVCSNEKLASMDVRLSTLYKHALSRVTDKGRFAIGQRQWLAERNECGEEPCVEKVYKERITDLEVWENR